MAALYVNALIYIITVVILFLKKRHSLILFLWVIYAIISIMGIIVVDYGIYNFFGDVSRYEFHYLPYILNYVCLLLTTLPLRNIRFGTFNLRKLVLEKKISKIINLFVLLMLILIVERLLELRLYGKMDYLERHNQIIANGESLLSRSSTPILWLINVTIGRLYTITYPIVMIYAFHQLKKSVVIMLIYLLPEIISCYTSGNRSSIFFLFINFSFFIILFYKYIQRNNKRNLIMIVGIAIVPIIMIVWGISIARFESSDLGVFGSISRYFGEVFPNLDFQYWNHVKNFTYGARHFSAIYSLFGSNQVQQLQGFGERFDFWSVYTGVSAANFKTLFGDLYVEFNTIGAVFFVFILSLLMEFYIRKNKKLKLSNIILIYVYFCYCSNAILDFPMLYFGSSWLKNYVAIIILNVIIKYCENKKLIKYDYEGCSCSSSNI